jgi:hypothetical protein
MGAWLESGAAYLARLDGIDERAQPSSILTNKPFVARWKNPRRRDTDTSRSCSCEPRPRQSCSSTVKTGSTIYLDSVGVYVKQTYIRKSEESVKGVTEEQIFLAFAFCLLHEAQLRAKGRRCTQEH